MKPQEIFDTVSKHLFDQGKRSLDNIHCRYYADDGLKCAVGILIPEDQYFEDMDKGNKSIKRLLLEYADKFPKWMHENVELLCDLQNAHDKWYNWEHQDIMEKSLEDIAKNHKLSAKKLETFKKEFANE
jgi:hypothetical protein